MKLGLQFSSVSESVKAYPGLNDESMQPRDLRTLLSRFVYNQSRRTFMYVFSFSSVGTTLNIVCTRATGESGDYDAATVFIPSGVRIEGGKLATLINLLKEDLILSPLRRQAPLNAPYCKFFEEEHSEDEYPVLPDPKSSDTAYLVFGYGQTHSSLVRLLINLYRPLYSNYHDVVLIDVQENVAAVQSSDLTDLSSSLLPSPNILFSVDVSGGVPPSGILVDGVYVRHLPIFVSSKISLGFEHERYSYTPQTIQVPPDGIVRMREVNWDMKICRTDFHILDPEASPVSECTIYINGRYLSNHIVLPVAEALAAEVSIDARAYHSFRSRLDLTQPSSYEIVLTNSRLANKYYVGSRISFIVENDDSDGKKSPLKGYRSVPTSRDAEYRLEYDWLSFFSNPLCYLVLLGMMAGAFFLGTVFSGFEAVASKQPKHSHEDSRPGIELFRDKGDSVSVAPSNETAVLEDTLLSLIAASDTVQNESDTVSSPEPAEEVPAPDTAAFDYIENTKVWNRDAMESIPELKGLWDAVNHYDYAKIESINETVKSPLLSDIIGHLRKSAKSGSYVLDPDPSDPKADKDITMSMYISKLK